MVQMISNDISSTVAFHICSLPLFFSICNAGADQAHMISYGAHKCFLSSRAMPWKPWPMAHWDPEVNKLKKATMKLALLSRLQKEEARMSQYLVHRTMGSAFFLLHTINCQRYTLGYFGCLSLSDVSLLISSTSTCNTSTPTTASYYYSACSDMFWYSSTCLHAGDSRMPPHRKRKMKRPSADKQWKSSRAFIRTRRPTLDAQDIPRFKSHELSLWMPIDTMYSTIHIIHERFSTVQKWMQFDRFRTLHGVANVCECSNLHRSIWRQKLESVIAQSHSSRNKSTKTAPCWPGSSSCWLWHSSQRCLRILRRTHRPLAATWRGL